jgi:hypothetical protein
VAFLAPQFRLPPIPRGALRVSIVEHGGLLQQSV